LRAPHGSARQRFQRDPQPVDNFVENLPVDGLERPRRAIRIGNRSL
jgi:hypothetical protein